MPRCDNVVPERAGISTVSILDASGVETVLFPFPQHGSVPESTDSYTDGEPTEWNVYLDEVVWSPQGKYIAFVASYRYACNRQDCYRFHIYVSNLDTGQLYILGEGRHVGWSSGGERINFFRLVTGTDGNSAAHLYHGASRWHRSPGNLAAGRRGLRLAGAPVARLSLERQRNARHGR